MKKEEEDKKLDYKENHQRIEFFENIANNINLDDEDEGNDDDDDHNEGVRAGRSSSSKTIKTEEKVPHSIPSESSMIEMDEEVDKEVLPFIINNTLV